MNKYCSFLIIILIVYITYEYCSSLTEGAIFGGYDSKADEHKDRIICKKGQAFDLNEPNSSPREPCVYEGKSCIDLVGSLDKQVKGDWNAVYTDYVNDKSKAGGNLKYNCSRCVQGSKQDGTVTRFLSNLSTKEGDPNPAVSKFAQDVCDAMAADCDNPTFYANNRQNWEHGDCSKAGIDSDNTLANKFVCKLLTNSFLQFFLGLLGGVTCTLKIKGKELENLPEELLCMACGCGLNPISCPVSCGIECHDGDKYKDGKKMK